MIFNPSSGAAAPVLTGIAVTTRPTTTTYAQGAAFNKSGMVVTAYFDDGSSTVVTGYSYAPTTLPAGTSSVTVSYTHEGVTKTTSVAVTVIADLVLYANGSYGSSAGTLKANNNVITAGANLVIRSETNGGTYNTSLFSNTFDLTKYKTLRATVHVGNPQASSLPNENTRKMVVQRSGTVVGSALATLNAWTTISIDVSALTTGCSIGFTTGGRSSGYTTITISDWRAKA